VVGISVGPVVGEEVDPVGDGVPVTGDIYF